jgi:hypothetical protein
MQVNSSLRWGSQPDWLFHGGGESCMGNYVSLRYLDARDGKPTEL